MIHVSKGKREANGEKTRKWAVSNTTLFPSEISSLMMSQ